MRLLWVGCALAVGCRGQNGVLLDVPAEHVEVFVARSSACDHTTCPITPPSLVDPTVGGTPFVGQGWIVDPSLVAIDITNGHSRFQLEPGASNGQGDVQIPALLMVALDSDGRNALPTGFATLTDVSVPQDSQVKIDVMLSPYHPLSDTSAGDALELWRKASDVTRVHAACALIHHADGSFEFFSPEDDSDCDDTEPHECNRFAFHGSLPPDDSTLSCVLPHASACRLGGSICVDGATSPGSVCMLPTAGEPYCVSPEICTNLSCGSSIDVDCVDAAFRGISAAVRCTVGLSDSDGHPCTQQQTTTVDLSPLSAMCQNIKISSASRPLSFVKTAAISQSQISVNAQSACTAQLSFIAGNETSNTISNALGLIDLESPSPNPVHRVVPLLLQAGSSGCAMSCVAPPAGVILCP